MRSIAAAFLLFFLAQDQAQPPPRFRTGVDVVELDVSVLDRDRRPIRGLTAADFTILEDGQPQDIVAFNEVNLPPPDPTTAGWMREVAPDVRSNDLSAGRLLVLVLDDATLPADPMLVSTAKDIARTVIASLGAQDLATVLFTLNNRNSQDFTNERSRLTRAVDKLTFGFIRNEGAGERSDERRLWYLYSIGTMRRAAEYLRDAPQRRKTLVYVSVGVPVNFSPAVMEMGGATGASDQDVALAAETQRAFAEAIRSNVTIYALDPAGLQVNDNRLNRDFLHAISENTGGYAVVNTNAPADQVASVMAESGSYYLLGFQSTNQKTDGKFRRISVRVNRPGTTVHARRGYYGARSGREAPGSPARGAGSAADAAIGGLLPKGDLPMQVTVAPFAVPGKRESALAIVTRLHQPPASERQQQKVEVVTAVFDVEGRSKGSMRQTAEVTVRPGDTDSRFEVLSRIDLKPGRYLLRVGARNATVDKSGSVYYDADVPDFSKAPISISGVVLGATPALHAEPKDALTSLMPLVPTTRREFERGQTVTAFMRMYRRDTRPPASAQVVVRIIDAAEKSVFHRTDTLGPELFGADRAADYRLEVPISQLAPGPHLLTIEATIGKTVARRDVRFLVR